MLWIRGFFGHGPVPQRFYGIQSLGQSVKLAIKFALNMILPFGPPVEVRNVFANLALFNAVLFITAALGAGACALVQPRKILLCLGWFLVAAAPTAVLGFYTDRYVGLPFVGLAILVGFIAQGAVGRKERLSRWIIPSLMGVYVVVSAFSLLGYKSQWRQAADKIDCTMNETRRLRPNVPARSVLYFVGLQHSYADGQVYVFNTGLDGMLWAWGYDKSVTARRSFRSNDPPERQLARRLSVAAADLHPPNGHYVFLSGPAGLKDISGGWAWKIVAQSVLEEPALWR